MFVEVVKSFVIGEGDFSEVKVYSVVIIFKVEFIVS